MGKLVMRLAQSTKSLQLLPVRMSDGRVLHLDLRETACMPYLLHGAIANEVGETMFIRSVVRSGEVAIDVGASVGWYSTLLAEIVGAKGQVYAFEPNTRSLRMLNASASAYRQLEVVPAALGDQQSETNLYVPGDSEMGSLRAIPGVVATQRCRVTTLDAFREDRTILQPSFIKCDAEGAELSIVRGALQTLNDDRPPMWLIEVSDWAAKRFGYRPATLIELFKELPGAGYRAYRIDSPTGELRPLPAKFDFRFNAVVVPAWQSERITVYRNQHATNGK
ncbi:MAG: hypothetical protein A2V70_04555 [Planctomycetes bacterium RBG_13_63_9]|nr:MAG: hypothetical protein A2V70_04555 [Planctomycetes bacterium RBG_13_63_9]